MPQDLERPCELYRKAVRDLFREFRSHPAASDERFRRYLQSTYEDYKARLHSSDPKSDPETLRDGLFILAAGLFAYGNLEVADDLLDYVPPSGSIRNLALALPALLPLSQDVDPRTDPEPIRQWLKNNRDNLRWSESRGTYVLAGEVQ